MRRKEDATSFGIFEQCPWTMSYSQRNFDSNVPKPPREFEHNGAVFCSVMGNNLTELVYNETLKTFVPFQEKIAKSNETLRRVDDVGVSGNSSPHPTSLEEPEGMSVQFAYGRLCPCSPVENMYCPDDTRSCRVSNETGIFTVTCYGEQSGKGIRYVFFLSMLLFGLALWLCAVSPRGRYSRGYLRRLLSCWNQDQYRGHLDRSLDQIIQRIRDQRQQTLGQRPDGRVYTGASLGWNRRLHRRQRQEQSPSIEAEILDRPAVFLKTSRFQPQQEPVECTICLTELEPHDKVGRLTCSHLFHVDCLKEWIRHKNHCPLCKGDALAQPESLTELQGTASTGSPELQSSTSQQSTQAGDRGR